MTISQEEFRAAIREVADEVTERDVPPLSLPADELRSRHVVRPRRALSRSVLTPLAAAVAVIAIIAAAVVLSDGPTAPRPSSVAGVRIRLGPEGVPPYFAGFDFGSSDVKIRSTSTGATVAAIRVPRPFTNFWAITGAADYWTFVLVAYNSRDLPSGGPARYFLAQFNPRTARVALRRLPIPGTRDLLTVVGVGLSANGRELAVAQQSINPLIGQLTLYSLATGRVKVWRSAAHIFNRYAGLSWSSTGTLAFNRFGALPKASGVWLLDTGTAGGDLLAHSRQAIAADQPPGDGQGWDGILTTNGKHVVLPVARAVGRVYKSGFQVYSAATGKLLYVLLPRTSRSSNGLAPEIAWAGATGNVLVVLPSTGAPEFGVLSSDRLKAIPHASGALGGLLVQLVF
jgi:hypothetical protein